MTYEYEIKIPMWLEDGRWLNMNVDDEVLEELEEVYRKAKAWEELKGLLMEEYPSVVHLADVSNGDDERGLMNKHEEVLEHMDKLDGTNEFRNLLRDMEDE